MVNECDRPGTFCQQRHPRTRRAPRAIRSPPRQPGARERELAQEEIRTRPSVPIGRRRIRLGRCHAASALSGNRRRRRSATFLPPDDGSAADPRVSVRCSRPPHGGAVGGVSRSDNGRAGARRREFVAVGGGVGAAADTDLPDPVEDFVGGVPRAHVREAGFDARARERRVGGLRPRGGRRELPYGYGPRPSETSACNAGSRNWPGQGIAGRPTNSRADGVMWSAPWPGVRGGPCRWRGGSSRGGGRRP